MISGKHMILMYRLNQKEAEALRTYYGSQYDVLDVSDRFSDVIALPARMIVLNPDEISDEEYAEMNEMFEWQDAALIVFSGRPHVVDPDKSISYFYYIETDIEHLSEQNPLGCDAELGRIDAFQAAIDDVDTLISEIEDTICLKDANRLNLASRTAVLRNGSMLYRHFLDLVKQCGDLPGEQRETCRNELLNVLIAMKLACGMLRKEDIIHFCADRREKGRRRNDDLDYICAMARIFRERRSQITGQKV